MLRVGRQRLPVVVADHTRVNDPAAALAGADGDKRRFHRAWAAALFCRTIDGYDAVVRLHDAHLDLESRAYSRIAFEHLVGFA